MRLTYKYEKNNGYGSVKLKNLPPDPFVDKLPYFDNAWEEQRNKLGQLEDIEEELGIDLIILFKALNNGIWIYDNGNPFFTTRIKLVAELDAIHCSISDIEVLLKDYGKTWALTREELE